jgi:hypothetical protein
LQPHNQVVVAVHLARLYAAGVAVAVHEPVPVLAVGVRRHLATAVIWPRGEMCHQS